MTLDNNVSFQNKNIEKKDNFAKAKEKLLKLKESLISDFLEKMGFKIEQSSQKGKYNLILDITSKLNQKQIKKLKQNINIDASNLLELKLYQINIPLNKLVKLAEFINRLINDSKGEKIFLTKKGFGSQSSTYSKYYNTTDFATKGKFFGKSLIGGTEELDSIIGPGNETIIVDFINKFNENYKTIINYLQTLK